MSIGIGPGIGVGIGGSVGGAGGGGPAGDFLIEGDSITSTLPSTYASTFWSYKWLDNHPAIDGEVRAQGSRVVGTSANYDDNGNSLVGNISEDIAYGHTIYVAKIGTNDFGLAANITAYTNGLIFLGGKLHDDGLKFGWSVPIPPNAINQHPQYANMTARRAELLAVARDPAYWGQFADYYIPAGEHPDWLDTAQHTALFGDTVHPSGMDAGGLGNGGQNRLYTCFNAAMETLADNARVNATTPYATVWPSNEVGLPTSTLVTRRIVISGVSHAGLAAGMSVSGGDVQIRLNGGAYGTSVGTGSGNGYRLYNGDVIDVKRTTSASASTPVTYDMTIGTDTRTISLTTTAAVDPVALSNAGAASSGPSSTSINLTGLTFGNGVAVVALTCFSTAGGSTSSVPTSLTLTPSGGGTAITLTLRQSGGRAGSRAIAVYTATVTAGTYDLTGTRPAAAIATWVSYATLENADPVPVAAPAVTAPANESDPHLATSVTVPSLGLAMGWLMKENSTAGSAGSGSTLVNTGDITQTGSTSGIVCVQRSSTGTCSMNAGFGTLGRMAMAFKALGT